MSYFLKKRHSFRIYHPEEKMTISSHETISFFHWITSHLANLGGATALFFSGFLISVKAFFHTKNKINEIQMKTTKVLDFRKDSHKPLSLK